MISKEYIAIEDLVETIVDNRGKSVPTTDNIDIPLIATNCIKFSSIYPVFENVRYINQETYDTWFRAHLKPNDILFVNKGTPGRCCITPDPVNFVGAQDMVGLRFRKEFDPFYMLAVIRSSEMQETIQNNHVGLVIAHFRKQELVKLKLPILQKELRDFIGKIYKNISLKIELNNKINNQLEAMTKTLYNYWFVQFNFPDAEGKPYKSSGGKMVYNEILKRKIPEGWEVKKLGDLTVLLNRGISPKYIENEEGIPVLNQKCIRENRIMYQFHRRHDIKSKSALNRLIEKYDVLVNSTGVGTLGRVALVRWLNESNVTVDSHVTIVRSSTEMINQIFFGYSVIMKQAEIESFANGSTGQVELNRGQLSDVNLIVPPPILQNDFASFYSPIIEKSSNIEKQNQELTQLRDWLLPMLMNEQVKVTDYLEMNNEPLAMVAEPALAYSSSAEKTTAWYDQRFELWVDQQGLAARGTLDKATLRELFDAMNDEDK